MDSNKCGWKTNLAGYPEPTIYVMEHSGSGVMLWKCSFLAGVANLFINDGSVTSVILEGVKTREDIYNKLVYIQC